MMPHLDSNQKADPTSSHLVRSPLAIETTRWVRLSLKLVMLGSALVTACGSAASARSPASFSEVSRPVAPAGATQSDEAALIAIDPSIRQACGIDDSEAFFAYNSAHVAPRDQALLGKLATCFASGPLKQKAMRLVGHADARGEADYNYLLAQRRADHVRDAIVAAGLASSRVSTTSRGEIEARGQDEASWARDRRVEVMLAGAI
jgi:peptidoglycan-associated lipoprotein